MKMFLSISIYSVIIQVFKRHSLIWQTHALVLRVYIPKRLKTVFYVLSLSIVVRIYAEVVLQIYLISFIKSSTTAV